MLLQKRMKVAQGWEGGDSCDPSSENDPLAAALGSSSAAPSFRYLWLKQSSKHFREGHSFSAPCVFQAPFDRLILI